MLFILVGVAVGVAAALNPIGVVADAVGSIADQFVTFGDAGVAAVLSSMSDSGHSSLVAVCGALVGAATPGLVTLALAAAARAASSARHLVVLAAVVVGVAAYVLLPPGGATIVAATAVVLAVAAAWAASAAASVVFAAVGAALAATTVRAVIAGGDSRIVAASETLAEVSGHHNAALWSMVTVVVALAPIVGAALLVLRD